MKTHPQISPSHLSRRAAAYIRQSSDAQVRERTGSTAIQRDLPSLLEELGWPAAQVDTIDGDLGHSASMPERRREFNTLLDGMRAGIYGAVAVTDDSRLLRNLWDLARFATIAQDQDVLLIQPGRITNFRDPNDEFIGVVLGANAARENRVRARLGRQARFEKAKQGKAISRPPAGYVKVSRGMWDKDPDPCAREAIQSVFNKFLQLGTLGRLGHYLVVNNINLPRRPTPSVLVWARPTKQKLRVILTNLEYTGTYVYGKSEVVRTIDPGSDGQPHRIVPRPATEWVRTPGHHPAYVSEDVFADIQERLRKNQCRLIGPLGRGEALVQGLVRCEVHNGSMRTAYPTRAYDPSGKMVRLAQYRCFPNYGVPGAKVCVQISARIADSLVENELLRALTAPSLQVLQETLREALREDTAARRAREDQLRRAKAAAADLERTFDQIDTALHPLVKRRLQTRYEDALREVDRLEKFDRLNPIVAPLTLDEHEVQRLRHLLDDLPRLWRHPHITPDQRKAVARMLITSVRVNRTPNSLTLTMLWVGGASTTLELPTYRAIGDEIEYAYTAGAQPSDIARDLARRGIARRGGPRVGQSFDGPAVAAVISRRRVQQQMSIKAYAFIRTRVLEHASNSAIANELNAKGIRHRLGLWTTQRVEAIVRRLRRGRIPGLEPLPPVSSTLLRIVTLSKQGLCPKEITAQLNAEGRRTRHRTPFTLNSVYRNLARGKIPPDSAVKDKQLDEFLRANLPGMSIKELLNRLFELGYRTRYGHPFTLGTLYRKLAQFDLRVRKPRGRSPSTPGQACVKNSRKQST